MKGREKRKEKEDKQSERKTGRKSKERGSDKQSDEKEEGHTKQGRGGKKTIKNLRVAGHVWSERKRKE